ncbi:3-dehydroquinate synthase, partial [candidate division KSB3 bacterium]|nr:3-dehydroquinate synthase [candidate division KSB3 bacterium]MBD3325656.1 3-dehydroquinate synthase [candidate division KSB3 bacterium]
MTTHTIAGHAGTSQIVLGEGLFSLKKYLHGNPCVLVSDERVHSLYGEHFPTDKVILIGTGESIKTLQTVELLYEKFLDDELDRACWGVAVGGGIVCD